MADSSFNLHSLLPQRGPLEGFQKAASDPAAFNAAFVWGIIFFGTAVFLGVASRNRWQVREVARQMNAGLFERSVLNPPKLSTVLRELHPQAAEFFKDVYRPQFHPSSFLQPPSPAKRALETTGPQLHSSPSQ